MGGLSRQGVPITIAPRRGKSQWKSVSLISRLPTMLRTRCGRFLRGDYAFIAGLSEDVHLKWSLSKENARQGILILAEHLLVLLKFSDGVQYLILTLKLPLLSL